MEYEQPILEPAAHRRWRERWRRWRSRLQVRMTLSFVAASVLSLLLLEVVFGSLTLIVSQRHSLLTIVTSGEIFRVLLGFVASGLFWALVAAPASVLLGLLTTRSIIRRLGRLVQATARFAEGDCSVKPFLRAVIGPASIFCASMTKEVLPLSYDPHNKVPVALPLLMCRCQQPALGTTTIDSVLSSSFSFFFRDAKAQTRDL